MWPMHWEGSLLVKVDSFDQGRDFGLDSKTGHQIPWFTQDSPSLIFNGAPFPSQKSPGLDDTFAITLLQRRERVKAGN